MLGGTAQIDRLAARLLVCLGGLVPVVFPNAVLPEVRGPRPQEGAGDLEGGLRRFAGPRRLDYSKVGLCGLSLGPPPPHTHTLLSNAHTLGNRRKGEYASDYI